MRRIFKNKMNITNNITNIYEVSHINSQYYTLPTRNVKLRTSMCFTANGVFLTKGNKCFNTHYVSIGPKSLRKYNFNIYRTLAL